MRISLEQAITLLKNGEVVAIPTETVYGLAADASNDSALQKIFSIKQRPVDPVSYTHLDVYKRQPFSCSIVDAVPLNP